VPAEVYVRGVKEALGELDAIQARVDAATLAAMKSAQTVAKAQIKSGMRGRPRWDKRGPIKSGRAAPAVNLNLSPHHVTKSGGPGSLTGHLRSAVGAVKRPKRTGQAQYSGGVGVGGPRSSTQIYRKEVEADYPYMAPGVKKAEAKMSAVWQKAWARAMDK
jgi:hypothetical protein